MALISGDLSILQRSSDKLMVMPFVFVKSGRSERCSQAVLNTHNPMGRMSPVCSAMNKISGVMSP